MRKYFEAALIRFAAWVLDRNVQRSPVINRRDNNYIFDVHFELHEIANRIQRNYEERKL